MDKAYYWMALDVHSRSCEFAASTPGGRITERRTVPTSIPPLVEAIRSVRRPRALVLEEGPMAGWLSRNLKEHTDRIIVCDPRRNHLIAKDGDKDDPIDTEKLLSLARGGFVREVHQAQTESRAILKQHVACYHDRVRHKVSEGHRVIWFVRRWGVVVTHSGLADESRRAEMIESMPRKRTLRDDLALLLKSYDLSCEQVVTMRRRLIRLARHVEQIRKFTAVPGVKWVRAATFYAILDTPFRFRGPSALWKYMGIGLERRTSGDGPVILGVPKGCNRVLKSVILGAARSAAASKDNNPFADRYKRLLHEGHSPRIARRTVARSLASVMWGMWKNQSEYRPDWVGLPQKELDNRSR
jgi:transposase